LLGDLDKETNIHNLAVPLGTAPITGVAGLALHGGMGLLSRKHGLSMDNILQVEVVTANGEVLIASPTKNADLFWGLRGAASNFGIVTNIVFQLFDIAPQIYGGLVVQVQFVSFLHSNVCE
jgi:FAD/FMN-containing dehydrogenase